MPINLGPITLRHLQAFAAKLACALHYHEAQRILPEGGGVVVIVRTLEQLARGWELPVELAAKLGLVKTLTQGRDHVADQFRWAAARDESGSLYVADLGGAISLLLWVCEDRDAFGTVRATGGHIHRPG